MARAKKASVDDLLDDEPTTPTKSKTKKKVVAKKKATAKKKAAPAGKLTITNEMVQSPTGRPVSKETVALRKKILHAAKKGITNIDLAAKLEIDTARSQSLAKPLVGMGLLAYERVEGRVTYTTQMS